MNANSTFFPVIIAGGGPAGMATSLTLAARGVPHALIEASDSAKPKPGEAIPPNAKPLFRQLGIQHLLESEQHTPYYGNLSAWGQPDIATREFLEDRFGAGVLLDRALFEQDLRAALHPDFCQTFFGYKLPKVTATPDGVEVQAEQGTHRLHLQCRYIVDATGRKSSVCRHLGVQKQTLDQQFALCCWVRHAQTIPRNIYIESVPGGWWYAAPVAPDCLGLMFFTLKSLLPSPQLSEAFLQQQLRATAHLRLLLGEEYTILPPVKTVPAGSSHLPRAFGAQWLAVGDAAYTFDPISSYGITSALASGYYGGHALADALAGKTDGFMAYHYIVSNAYAAYYQKLMHHYQQETRWPEAAYWAGRFVV